MIESSFSVSTSSQLINTSIVQLHWNHPSHSDLIQNYIVSISNDNDITITSASVGKQTSYSYKYDFVPGNMYFFKITSYVKIPNPSEQFTESSSLEIVVGKFI